MRSRHDPVLPRAYDQSRYSVPSRRQAVFLPCRRWLRAGCEVIEALDGVGRRAAIYRQIDRLNLLTPANPHLPFPHSSQVRGELRELRCHYGSELYRILYRRSRNLVVLLHMFRKDTGRIPEREVRAADECWKDFRARMDAERRRRPRAAGHDAP